MAKPWFVPPIWAGKTVAIFASGPSMSADVVESAKRVSDFSIAINDTWTLSPDSEMLYAADGPWWHLYEKDLSDFRGLKVTADERCNTKGVHLLRRTGIDGFDPDISCIRTGNNSGYQAIHVAIHARAKRILLFGYDMHGTHWFGNHPKPLRNHNQRSLEGFVRRFSALVGKAEILNCTPGSRITCFPMVSVDELLVEA